MMMMATQIDLWCLKVFFFRVEVTNVEFEKVFRRSVAKGKTVLP